MTLTPAIKGQLTKAVKSVGTDGVAYFAAGKYNGTPETLYNVNQTLFIKVRTVFLKHLPPQQAKHATRKFISELAAK